MPQKPFPLLSTLIGGIGTEPRPRPAGWFLPAEQTLTRCCDYASPAPLRSGIRGFGAFTHARLFFSRSPRSRPITETRGAAVSQRCPQAQLRPEVRLHRGTAGGEPLVNRRSASALKALAVRFGPLGAGRWGRSRALLRRAVQHRRSTRSAEARIPSGNL